MRSTKTGKPVPAVTRASERKPDSSNSVPALRSELPASKSSSLAMRWLSAIFNTLTYNAKLIGLFLMLAILIALYVVVSNAAERAITRRALEQHCPGWIAPVPTQTK